MNLFDRATYHSVRRPVLDAETLPPGCYTSDEFFKREVSEIFLKCWNLIGRIDYLKQPGDYFTHSFAGTSIIIVKGQDDRVRAFVNACRHRGAKLLEGSGNCRTIVCPYHSWVYNPDGSLRVANAMRDTHDFDAGEYGLLEVKLDTWSGFIFVNCDSNAMPLRTYLGNLDDYTASYNFADMVTTKRQEYKIRTNWKCYIENSLENLHLPTVHQKSIGGVKAEWIPVNGTPGNFVMLRSRTKQSRAVLDGDTGFEPIAGLNGTAAEGAQYILVYPCTVIGADLDCMWFKQMIPDGPDTVRNVAAFCFTKEAVARPDFDRIVQNYYRRYDVVISEDNGISEMQYAGLENPLVKQGRFSSSECLVHTIDNWILDRVLGPEHTR